MEKLVPDRPEENFALLADTSSPRLQAKRKAMMKH
jgi:hypothetical protein